MTHTSTYMLRKILYLLAMIAASGFLMAASIEGYLILLFFVAVFILALYFGFRKKEEE
jgi:4-hydroxybenzoate polyprenyltransferase